MKLYFNVMNLAIINPSDAYRMLFGPTPVFQCQQSPWRQEGITFISHHAQDYIITFCFDSFGYI